MEHDVEKDRERVDPRRTLLLGAWTLVMAVAFLALLVADNATAITVSAAY